ncbi:hypothetical protein DFH07DRAFT_1057176 [Mycena maculata]|uniref:F-box domain-containing protein n=1 Tax=Mycena maculata TaxID=230809 RepID=A0AAD7JZH5_9AGAR|nr:hypothetical protein DFH07DRAFT_1057176 [Mycena maculata]
MVLTRRGHKARMMITRWLPNEIIIEIVRATPRKADQAALCRVSKLFHSLALPVLNRVVKVRNNTITAFCTALIADPTRADVIRSFTFVDYGRGPRTVSPVDLLFEAMNLMHLLEHLSIDFKFTSYPVSSGLSLLTFPRISSCKFGGRYKLDPTDADIVAHFFTRHPTITRLHIYFALTRISLPNLHSFDGFAPSIPMITAQGLKAARLAWTDGSITADNIFTTLNSLTNPVLPFVSSHTFYTRAYTTVLPSLSMQMPHTTTLEIRLAPILPDNGIINHLTQCLPRLNHLVYLALHCVFPRANQHYVPDPWAIVQTWANHCPTLEACSLFDNTWKKVDGSWLEYPKDDFRDQAGLSVFEIQ